MPITYLTGDATKPEGSGPKIIVHIANDIGAWGSGFVLALTRRWREPEVFYRTWHKHRIPAMTSHICRVEMGEMSDRLVEMTGIFGLGQSQLVNVERGLYVLNMIAQRGIAEGGPRAEGRVPAVRYDALALCLRQANRFAKDLGASLVMPRIGCGLGGGTWDKVAPLIERFVLVPATVYDLGAPGGK